MLQSGNQTPSSQPKSTPHVVSTQKPRTTILGTSTHPARASPSSTKYKPIPSNGQPSLLQQHPGETRPTLSTPTMERRTTLLETFTRPTCVVPTSTNNGSTPSSCQPPPPPQNESNASPFVVSTPVEKPSTVSTPTMERRTTLLGTFTRPTRVVPASTNNGSTPSSCQPPPPPQNESNASPSVVSTPVENPQTSILGTSTRPLRRPGVSSTTSTKNGPTSSFGQPRGGQPRRNTTQIDQPRRGRGINVGDLPPNNPDDRPHIAVDERGEWLPDHVPVIRTIGAILKRHLMGPYANWSMVSRDHKNIYWNVFCKTYQWDVEQESSINNLFMKGCVKRMCDDFSLVGREWRTKKKVPDWLPDRYLPGLIKYWSSDKFIKMSKANTNNRNKGPKASHTGGSININTHARKLPKRPDAIYTTC